MRKILSLILMSIITGCSYSENITKGYVVKVSSNKIFNQISVRLDCINANCPIKNFYWKSDDSIKDERERALSQAIKADALNAQDINKKLVIFYKDYIVFDFLIDVRSINSFNS